jgi:hypothetical protein
MCVRTREYLLGINYPAISVLKYLAKPVVLCRQGLHQLLDLREPLQITNTSEKIQQKPAN